MSQPLEKLHIISTKKNLKLAPGKSFFMLLKFHGHEIGYNTIEPIHSENAAIHKIPSPTRKVALMSFISALDFYTNFKENSILISNHFTIFYIKTLHGIRMMKTKVSSKH